MRPNAAGGRIEKDAHRLMDRKRVKVRIEPPTNTIVCKIGK